MTHIILLLLIAGEDADFADVSGQEAIQSGVAKGTGTAGNE